MSEYTFPPLPEGCPRVGGLICRAGRAAFEVTDVGWEVCVTTKSAEGPDTGTGIAPWSRLSCMGFGVVKQTDLDKRTGMAIREIVAAYSPNDKPDHGLLMHTLRKYGLIDKEDA